MNNFELSDINFNNNFELSDNNQDKFSNIPSTHLLRLTWDNIQNFIQLFGSIDDVTDNMVSICKESNVQRVKIEKLMNNNNILVDQVQKLYNIVEDMGKEMRGVQSNVNNITLNHPMNEHLLGMIMACGGVRLDQILIKIEQQPTKIKNMINDSLKFLLEHKIINKFGDRYIRN